MADQYMRQTAFVTQSIENTADTLAVDRGASLPAQALSRVVIDNDQHPGPTAVDHKTDFWGSRQKGRSNMAPR